MKRAHVLLFPAVREGWGLSVIEANAVGTPAIGYDVPGLRDAIVDGRTGSLVASGDMAEMANESVRLLLNESEWSKIAREALEYSRGFDWDNTASQFLKRLAS
ncbi:MAG: glycosyltransferase [Methanobacteriota archaeon]|nr:MAG: glycosyltransferase [Euryarchaeota archaeon]